MRKYNLISNHNDKPQLLSVERNLAHNNDKTALMAD